VHTANPSPSANPHSLSTFPLHASIPHRHHPKSTHGVHFPQPNTLVASRLFYPSLHILEDLPCICLPSIPCPPISPPSPYLGNLSLTHLPNGHADDLPVETPYSICIIARLLVDVSLLPRGLVLGDIHSTKSKRSGVECVAQWWLFSCLQLSYSSEETNYRMGFASSLAHHLSALASATSGIHGICKSNYVGPKNPKFPRS
jgi:hypothetical protein